MRARAGPLEMSMETTCRRPASQTPQAGPPHVFSGTTSRARVDAATQQQLSQSFGIGGPCGYTRIHTAAAAYMLHVSPDKFALQKCMYVERTNVNIQFSNSASYFLLSAEATLTLTAAEFDL